jgi:protein-L-isoaspartate(D-aspartate) O-methyltransferase
MAATNEALVEELIAGGYLKTEILIEAFRQVKREDFVVADFQNAAYENVALPIGFGQTISQPLTVAFMLELLLPMAGEKILEIGAGSGWQAALLAFAVGENGRVISLERIEELKKMAEKNLDRYPELKKRITIVLADGARGYEAEAPYDKIIAAAAAAEAIPEAWRHQLKTGGRIVAPVKESIMVFDKITADKFESREYYGFDFVPLVTD